MPKRRRASSRKYGMRKRRRKMYRARRRANRPRVQPSLIAKSQLVKLTYCDIIEINPGLGGALGTYTFRANSLYDPNFTGTGHQPLGFDQWAGFYRHYVVIGAKCIVKAVSTDSSNATAVAVNLDDDAAPTVQVLTEMGERNNMYDIMAPVGSGPCKSRTLVAKYSAKRFHGVKDIRDNHDLRSDMSGSPGELAYFHVHAADLSGGDDVAPIQIHVKIRYIAILTERIALQQS